MKTIIKSRWAIFSIWLLATVLLTISQPDINSILQQRGQSPLPDNSPSVVADSIKKKMESSEGTNNLIVFYSQNGLSNEEMNRIDDTVKDITASSSKLGIEKVVDPFSNPDVKNSLISADGTTLMVSFKLNKLDRKVDDIKAAFESKLKNVGVEYYLTGQDFIANDYVNASVSGIEKSAILTVFFILIILIIMFRSVVTPVVSLLTVAFSYLVSIGIAAQLIDKANFPVTTLTQILLVMILFGIGTDYNILLFNRFKEELSHGSSTDEAIIQTYKTAGKTIAFSVLTILIAFFSLIFSESPIYKSGIVVVIGAAILLLQIMTLTPFSMKVLGKRIFWPSKSADGHNESKLWGKVSTFSTKRSLFSIMVVVIIIGATVFFYQQKLSFDQIGELGDSHPSSKGFGIVAEHFGKGEAISSTLVLESNGTLDNNDALSVIDKITENIKNIDGVKQVASVTQPRGTQIDNFYISNQMTAVTKGLTTMQDGLNKMGTGFGEGQAKLDSADFSKIDEMVDGTAKLHDAMSALTSGLSQLQAGLADGTDDSATISNGIVAIEKNLSTMSSGLKTLIDNYSAMQTGFKETGRYYQDVTNALLGIKATLPQMQSMVAALGDSYTNSKNDPNYSGLKNSIDSLISTLKDITPEGVNALNSRYNAITAGFGEANKNLTIMSAGLSQMAVGLNKVNSGLTKASKGVGTIVTNMNSVTEGLDKMKSGQRQLASGLNNFSSFGTQLSDVSTALKDISGGLEKSKDFLSQYNKEKTFHIPAEALTSGDFKPALDTFMSSDRTVTKMIIVLKYDPYSMDAINTIQEINTAVTNGVKGTVLSDARFGVAGPSSTTNDMNDVLNRDLTRMIIIVLTGIFLVLLFIIRSFWTSIFITISLVGSYFAAIFVSNTIFIQIMHYTGLSSFVPFFSFIIIAALGVDYSIFLMMRFKEYKHLPPKDAIVKASKQIGGVVMSAVIILGGTFATLMPSGLLLLSELAVTVIAGLAILCFIMLLVFLPAMISLVNKITKLGLENNEKDCSL
ncbi:MmpL domain-containing protein [Ruminiclostridium papyrosolvens DSM 2782]|uniref:MmpL domain-containing protein n=1 Tax=Ruminiclostridium papyrosolvens DSM 2782 TaxID=588581 RepID=F1TAE8_9FIRM|nr:MMPL family transporter [Ruminiclostridium papyrosolvens]EGD48491.1 MmpL domain-containing protein [Ruminiclostridium papyrosolvens DSM 2782]WES32751.1 MMPL family transporter [Ruminiclostridium papyrosolvens DSM 2782]